MKFRIMKNIYSDGSVDFTVQRKLLWFWATYKKEVGIGVESYNKVSISVAKEVMKELTTKSPELTRSYVSYKFETNKR